jgi:hypothetical protein
MDRFHTKLVYFYVNCFHWRHDTQQNDIQRNNTQHKGLICDTQHKNCYYAECRIFDYYAECHYAECGSALSLAWTKTLAFDDIRTKKIRNVFIEQVPVACIFVTNLCPGKHSLTVNVTVFTKLHFLPNLRMSPIS